MACAEQMSKLKSTFQKFKDQLKLGRVNQELLRGKTIAMIELTLIRSGSGEISRGIIIYERARGTGATGPTSPTQPVSEKPSG